jgi:hypothetical protein
MMKKLLLSIALLAAFATAAHAEMKVEVSVGTSVKERVPQNVATEFPASTEQLLGWCRVTGATEPIEIYHRWRRNGKDEALVKLPVRSSSYRVWSYCAPKGRTGLWTLEVLDWDKNVLATTAFEIK